MIADKPLIVFHAPCPDGWCSAYIAQKFMCDREPELFEGTFNTAPPLELMHGRAVYIVDFSYPRAAMEAICDTAAEVVILDHHLTAFQALADLERDNLTKVFAVARSGAGITWDYFHRGLPGMQGAGNRHWIVDYVEDRDLWKFRWADSHDVSTFLRSVPYTVRDWDHLYSLNLGDVKTLAKGARQQLDHYVRVALRDVREVVLSWTEPIFVHDAEGGWVDALNSVKAVSVCAGYDGSSDIMDAALKAYPQYQVAIVWRIDRDECMSIGFRSRNGYDTTPIAKYFGGGGHAQASGCRIPLNSDRNDWNLQAHRIIFKSKEIAK